MRPEWELTQLALRLATLMAQLAIQHVVFTLECSVVMERKFVLTKLSCKASWTMTQLRWHTICLTT